jgi:hypothetical protein
MAHPVVYGAVCALACVVLIQRRWADDKPVAGGVGAFGVKDVPLPVLLLVLAGGVIALCATQLSKELDKPTTDRCGVPPLGAIAENAGRQPEHGSVCLEQSHTANFFDGQFRVSLGPVSPGRSLSSVLITATFTRHDSSVSDRLTAICHIEQPLGNGGNVSVKDVEPEPLESQEYTLDIDAITEHSVRVFAESRSFGASKSYASHNRDNCYENSEALTQINRAIKEAYKQRPYKSPGPSGPYP